MSQPITPPAEITRVGKGDFTAIGRAFLKHFIELGGLKPSDRVLDVGCGIGRMALPLTEYLNANGGYEGLDIQPPAIAWCQQNITPAFPNFRFQLIDVRNTAYNPNSLSSAADFRFPWADATFDFAILTSIFTHLLPADMEQYTAELARVLRPGGRCLITFFLANEESTKLSDVPGSNAKLKFKHRRGVYRLNDDTVPEAAVCYDETYVSSMLDRHRLSIDGAIHYGTWCGRSTGLSYQDILVASRSPIS